MRLYLIFVTGVVISSTSFAKKDLLVFPISKFSTLKSKKISEALCDRTSSYQLKLACSDLKAANDTLEWVAPKIEFDSNNSFKIRSGNISTKVSRTKKPTVFEVNYKKIDISEYKDILNLKEAVKSALPSFSMFSILINRAYAEEVNYQSSNLDYEQMTTAIALILKATSDQDICEAAANLAKACGHYPDSGSQTLLKIVESYKIIAKPTSLNDKFYNQSIQKHRKVFDFAHMAFKIELLELSARLASLESKKDMLLSCKSIQKQENKSGWDDISECHKSISQTYAQAQLLQLPDQILPMLKETDKDLGYLLNQEQKKSNLQNLLDKGAVK
ncbi:MAG: hypothetical protein ACOYOK_15645 [Pseudobdellovibrionaceae bacterium]